MPMMIDPEQLASDTTRLRELCEANGRSTPEVVVLTGFDPRDPPAAAAHARALHDAGATKLVAGTRYDDADGFRRQVEFLATIPV